MAFEMVLERLLLALQLSILGALVFSTALWMVGLLPARGHAVLGFLSRALDAVLGVEAAGDLADAAAASSSPVRSFFAVSPPASPPSSPDFFSRPSLRASETMPPFAWERQQHPSSPTTATFSPAVLAWYHARVAQQAMAPPKKTKTVRFADDGALQAKAISASPRRSAAHPPPAPLEASPPVVEPFDPVAYVERMRAFHEAISMPDGSLIDHPTLGWAGVVSAPQPASGWWPEMPRPAPAAATPAPPPPSPPKTAPPPPPPPAAPKRAASEPEKPQQDPSPPAPPPPPPPASAATPVRDPSGTTSTAAAPAKPTAPPASSSAAPKKPAQNFTFSVPSGLFSTTATAPANLTPVQDKHRQRVLAAQNFLDEVERSMSALPSGTMDARRSQAWTAAILAAGADARLADIEQGLRVVLETAQDDAGELLRAVFPVALLGAMGLRGPGMVRLVRGFEDGNGMLRDFYGKGKEKKDVVGRIVAQLHEMSNFFGRY